MWSDRGPPGGYPNVSPPDSPEMIQEFAPNAAQPAASPPGLYPKYSVPRGVALPEGPYPPPGPPLGPPVEGPMPPMPPPHVGPEMPPPPGIRPPRRVFPQRVPIPASLDSDSDPESKPKPDSSETPGSKQHPLDPARDPDAGEKPESKGPPPVDYMLWDLNQNRSPHTYPPPDMITSDLPPGTFSREMPPPPPGVPYPSEDMFGDHPRYERESSYELPLGLAPEMFGRPNMPEGGYPPHPEEMYPERYEGPIPEGEGPEWGPDGPPEGYEGPYPEEEYGPDGRPYPPGPPYPDDPRYMDPDGPEGSEAPPLSQRPPGPHDLTPSWAPLTPDEPSKPDMRLMDPYYFLTQARRTFFYLAGVTCFYVFYKSPSAASFSFINQIIHQLYSAANKNNIPLWSKIFSPTLSGYMDSFPSSSHGVSHIFNKIELILFVVDVIPLRC